MGARWCVCSVLLVILWAVPGSPLRHDGSVALSERGASPPIRTAHVGSAELVESVPVETSLDLPALRNTVEVWREMIQAAEHTIDIETFYLSSSGTGADSLETVLECLADAADRGVVTRLLVDAGFRETYPEVVARLEGLPGAAARSLDVRRL